MSFVAEIPSVCYPTEQGVTVSEIVREYIYFYILKFIFSYITNIRVCDSVCFNFFSLQIDVTENVEIYFHFVERVVRMAR